MAADLKFVDRSFRIGCGRYIQEAGALSFAGREALRLVTGIAGLPDGMLCPPGKEKIAVICGRTALSEGSPALDDSLRGAGFEPVYYIYEGFCNPGHGDRMIAEGLFDGASLVVGAGGGNVMDISKYCSIKARLPLLNIPTTSATCAACTPLSVLYDDECGYLRSQHWPVEVGCVIADTDVLARQPLRMMTSGVFDAVAKLPEISHRLRGRTEDETDAGLFASSVLGEYTWRRLFELLPSAAAELSERRCGKALYDLIFLTVCLTGAISGLARGSNQSALAHKIYETSRTLRPGTVRDYLHGELVAIGMIVQIAYNDGGDCSRAGEFRKLLAGYSMPLSLKELGLPASDAGAFYDAIASSSAMAGTSDSEKKLLRDCLGLIF